MRGNFSKAGTTSFSSAQVLSCPCPSASAGTLAASHQCPQVDVAHPSLPSTIGTYHSLSSWRPRNKMGMRRDALPAAENRKELQCRQCPKFSLLGGNTVVALKAVASYSCHAMDTSCFSLCPGGKHESSTLKDAFMVQILHDIPNIVCPVESTLFS